MIATFINLQQAVKYAQDYAKRNRQVVVVRQRHESSFIVSKLTESADNKYPIVATFS